jgi:hypothetical protein
MLSAELDGAVELRKAMHKFTPDLANNLEAYMAHALRPIVSNARSFVPSQAPLSTWELYSRERKGRFPMYDSAAIKAGIEASTEPTKPNRKGFAYAAEVVNSTAIGSIIETAGRKNPNGRKKAQKGDTSRKYSQSANPYAGKQFIDALEPIFKVQSKNHKGASGRRKMNGRLIFKAWGQDEGKINGTILHVVNKTIQEFHKRTNNSYVTAQRKVNNG